MLIIRLVLFICIFFNIHSVNAQFTVYVFEHKTTKPISDVKIFCKNCERKIIYTNASGYFEMEALTKNYPEVELSKIGYKNAKHQLAKSGICTLYLEPQVYNLSEVHINDNAPHYIGVTKTPKPKNYMGISINESEKVMYRDYGMQVKIPTDKRNVIAAEVLVKNESGKCPLQLSFYLLDANNMPEQKAFYITHSAFVAEGKKAWLRFDLPNFNIDSGHNEFVVNVMAADTNKSCSSIQTKHGFVNYNTKVGYVFRKSRFQNFKGYNRVVTNEKTHWQSKYYDSKTGEEAADGIVIPAIRLLVSE
jgi:hypothetical protein